MTPDPSNDLTPRSGNPITRGTFLRGAAAGGIVLAGVGGLAAACGGSTTASSSTVATTTGSGKRGGSLTMGIAGGTNSDTLDAHKGLTNTDASRSQQLYNALVVLDVNAQVQYDLAESITPNSDATLWTIKLRSGVTFHDGSPLTVEDLVFTLNRIKNPAAPLAGASSLGPMDLKNLKKVDTLTLQIPMTSPYASFVDQLASYFYFLYVVPTNYDPKKAIGTGPFKLHSFTPGRQSVFVRNPNYWKSGLPYLDQVTITDYPDAQSMVGALTSNQVDAIASLAATDLAPLNGNANVTVLTSKSGSFQPFTMRVDQAPFNDVRVRQAFRYMVDRPQLIATALDGAGTVGNDVFSPFDPCYDHGNQREQDIDRAKSLLKAAGKSDLTVELVTAPINIGTVGMAQVLAQQASQAGVKVNLKQVDTTTFFGPNNYLQWTFSQDFWLYNPYLAQVAQGTLPASPFNEAHFNNPQYNKLYNQANATTDANKRCEIVKEMQTIDFNEGGYIIPAFVNVNDAYSNKFAGFLPSKIGESLGNYGFDKVSLA